MLKKRTKKTAAVTKTKNLIPKMTEYPNAPSRNSFELLITATFITKCYPPIKSLRR